MGKDNKTSEAKELERELAQESVFVKSDTIVKRFSNLFNILDEDDLDLDDLENDTLELPNPEKHPLSIENEEDFFHKIVGRKLDQDRYEILAELTTGGMGILHKVYDKDFKRQTVMKALLPEYQHEALLIQSFIHEARITGQLEHPNIVPVHDLDFTPGKGVFFTMKPVRGEALSQILRKLENGDEEYANRYHFHTLLEIFRKVCDAVAFAHSKRVIHRDIKPQNIMVGDYGEVLLMDWGIAKDLTDDDSVEEEILKDFGVDHIMDGAVLKGSPGYMSPEQAYGYESELDERSDIFLLGATLYHIFTFFPPYLGPSVGEVVEVARECNFIPPSELNIDQTYISEELCKIINRCMKAEKAERYQSLEELISDLDDLIQGRIEFKSLIFEAGEYLIREGEEGENCYIVSSGKVEVFKGEGDQRFILNVLGEGAVLGEMSILTQHPRSASVIALEKTVVKVMTKDIFEKNLSRLPGWMDRAITALADRLDKADCKYAAQFHPK